MVLTSTLFIAAGSLMFEQLPPALVSAPILWWHTRCHPHGAATGVLTMIITVYTPFALGTTTGELDSDGGGVHLDGPRVVRCMARGD